MKHAFHRQRVVNLHVVRYTKRSIRKPIDWKTKGFMDRNSVILWILISAIREKPSVNLMFIPC